MEDIGEIRIIMTNKKIKLDDILGGKWRNLPEDDRKFVEYVCLKRFAAMCDRPDWCKTDDEKIDYIISELVHSMGVENIVKSILNRSFQGVTTFLDPDRDFLYEHPDDKPDLLYTSPEGDRTLTIEVKQDDAITVKDGYLLIPSRVNTHHADFVAVLAGHKLYVASRDDNYQIGYEFDL